MACIRFFYAYTSGDSASTQALTVGYTSDSASNVLVTGAPIPASWTTLRVVTLTSGGLQIYADGTVIYSATVSVLAGEKNAGLWSFRNGSGLSNRWDNFSVLPVP